MSKKTKTINYREAEIDAYDDFSLAKANNLFADIHDRIIPEIDKLYNAAIHTYGDTGEKRIFVDAMRVCYARDDAHNLMVKLADILGFDVDLYEQEKRLAAEEAKRKAEEDDGVDEFELPF